VAGNANLYFMILNSTNKLALQAIALFFSLALLALTANAEVKIQGIESPLIDNVRAFLALDQEKCDAPSWRLSQRRREVEKQVSKALEAYGYYSPTISKEFSRDDNCWLLELNIDPGARVQLREVDIRFSQSTTELAEELQKLLNKPPLRSGDGLNHKTYDNYKASIIDTAHESGHWKASFSKALLAIYPEDAAADIVLHFDPGPRHRFGEFVFSDVYLNQDLLYRLTTPLAGEYYSAEDIRENYDRLQASNYFRQVLIKPLVSNDIDDLEVPIAVDLHMNSRHSFGAGIGYSTDRGIRVRGDYRNNYLNRAGHQFRSHALWSEKLRELAGTYVIPRKNAAEEWWEIGAGNREETTDSYWTATKSANVRMITELPYDWIMNVGLNLMNERYIVDDDTGIENKKLIIPGIGFGWLNAEETTRQTQGLRIETEITTSSNNWKSDVDYLQLKAKGKFIVSPTHRIRLISRLELGDTQIEKFTDLPPSVRFFTGGDNSVRGYAYNSLGILNDEGEVIGGGRLAVGSVELDGLILKNWSLSTFYDAGDAFDDPPTQFSDLKRSWGVGVRWFSPVGALRFDLAFPESGDDDYRIHISVGADL